MVWQTFMIRKPPPHFSRDDRQSSGELLRAPIQ